jgi:glycosyltransferase involved in cell wall biosynthesis
MRVLELTNTYPPGDVSGVGTLVQELARALVASGHEPVVWTRRSTGATESFVTPIGGPKLLFPLAAGWRMLTGGAAARFDAVHVHESDGVVALLALALLRAVGSERGKARRIATLQVSYREERRTTRPVRDRGEIVSRPSVGERRFARLRAPLLALAGRITARLADVVVAPSRQTAAELARDYGAREVLVIPNGVPAADASRREPPPAPTVLYAGRLRARKAPVVLIRAFAKVVERLPAARLVIAGDGDERAGVEREIARLGLGANVELLGAVSRAEVARRLPAASVFCLPSIYEGLPLAILEAMAAGVPVVTTAVSGHPDAVVDGESGWLVPAEDSAALASALIHALTDPAEARRRSAAASARFAERFEIGVVARRYVELLAPARS